MLQRVADLKKTEAYLEVSTEECKRMPGAWTVEAIEVDGDGAIYQAIFIGPDAEERAQEYAAFKYEA